MDSTASSSTDFTSVYSAYLPQRRVRQQFILDANAVPEEDDTLEELLHQTWNIFAVSVLFNFYRDEVHLKKYAKRIKEEVAATSTLEDVTYNATVSIMEDATRPSSLDPLPLKIVVYARKNTPEETKEKIFYNGIFLSWRTTQSNSFTENSLRLPLLLCRGTKSCMRAVHDVLSYMFDCMVIALPMKEDDLLWLVPILIVPINGEEDSKDTDEIHVTYRIPNLPNTDTITFHFKLVELIKILTVIIEDQSNDARVNVSFNLKDVEEFRKCLYDQAVLSSGVQLGLCLLHEIRLPAFTVMDNRMKVMKAGAMNRVLLYLNEKALSILYSLNPGA